MMAIREVTRNTKLYLASPQLATCMAYRDAATEFWQCAEAYYRLNISKDKFTMSKVVFYLIGLSLELYCKAFIILAEDTQKGYEDKKKKLKNIKIRHNLSLLCAEAKRKGLSSLTKEDRGLIYELNNKYYSCSNFRYKQGVIIDATEVANFLEIELPSLRYYFALMLKIQKEANRKIYAR